VKSICQFCGWEIANPQWYNKYRNKPICDECEVDQAMERVKEEAK
jgi:Na+-transporting NADH:ubiquinone oxidoreductase subunit NqrC